MRFGQSIESNKRNTIFQNNAKNEAGGLVPDLYLCFKKALYEVKQTGQTLLIALNLVYNQKNCLKL